MPQAPSKPAAYQASEKIWRMYIYICTDNMYICICICLYIYIYACINTCAMLPENHKALKLHCWFRPDDFLHIHPGVDRAWAM